MTDISALRKFAFPALKPGTVIDLSNFTSILVGAPDKLYIRSEYIVAIEQWNASSSGFILTGSPGIGKSTFGKLFLCYLISKGEKVMYWQLNLSLPILFSGGKAEYFDMRTLVGYDFSDITIIYDDKKGFQSKFDCKFHKYLIIHSPSADISNSEKAVGLSSGLWCMNPATLEECNEIREKCSWKCNEDDVVERFLLVGGLFRYLQKDTAELRRTVNEGCLKVATNIIDITRCNSLPASDEKLSHKVIHMHRVPDSDTGIFLEFGSEFIAKTIIEASALSNEAQLLKIVNCVDINGSLRGDIFENRMHSILSCFSDFTFSGKSLPGESSSVKTFSVKTASAMQFQNLSSIEKVLKSAI